MSEWQRLGVRVGKVYNNQERERARERESVYLKIYEQRPRNSIRCLLDGMPKRNKRAFIMSNGAGAAAAMCFLSCV